ncbi:uncharacterized protein LOC126736466 [Anthonomus grandis grandis]|uniref:uncharacterized protein LOC126736466 n=1 Tax=Anthonomus grandis grandis TaxID=2921223 RepID=UPI002165D20D|nr:uncharacterized protein LOC126736466 [Anthonomus grandis grandis]
MDYFKVLLIISCLFCLISGLGDEDITCRATSCKNAVCDPVNSKCSTSITNSGVYMLSPDICNCCEYCLQNLAQGDTCSVGDPSQNKFTSICGPGLACLVSSESSSDGTCQPMSTSCAKEQQSYDIRRKNGYLGTMETRALCDEDGFYGKYKCIPGQSCYCLHSNGSRIFGEKNYNTLNDYMSCACSRAYYDAVDTIGRELYPHEHFKCNSDGSFASLQCINEECLCVDSQDGAPTYPDDALVKIDEINKETLPCYTSTKQGQYYTKCEKEFLNIYKEVQELKRKNSYNLILGYKYPKCDLDGSYQAVQENFTHKYCVDKEGNMLTSPILKTNSLAAAMDCKCVRATLLISTAEKPSCQENGNYEQVQCRRGVCRCVDSDGNQKCSSTTKLCEEMDEKESTKLTCS